MDFLDVVFGRKTTNGPFLPDPIHEEHQRTLLAAAGAAPSQLNSQPWRFVVIEDRATIGEIGQISGESMTKVMAEGSFFDRYKRYFRFSAAEMNEKRDGMHFDQLPKLLRPFTKRVFTPSGQAMINRLGIPKTLGAENRKLVSESPLLIGVLLDREEYRPGELSGFYSQFSMGAAVENIWLTTLELGMGIQFVSFPMESVDGWKRIETLLAVPDDLALMAVYRLGYLPPSEHRGKIDWSSRHRKRPSQYIFRETCERPQEGWDEA